MIIYLFSDEKYEYQAHACIKSFEHKVTDDIKVVYFTIGFDSNITSTNLIKVRVPINPIYPKFMYYKPELALKVMEMFPEESDFVFTDTDILFTHRVQFKELAHNYDYPLAIYLTYEFPFGYKYVDGEIVYFTEENLMKYFNVQTRSMRYQGSGFFVYNRQCIDFLKEWTSICKNEYLLEQEEEYFPFPDETAMNICLWKRNAVRSLGHVFVNTLHFNTIKTIEENKLQNTFLGNNIDDYGSDTEYVPNLNQVWFYHGIRDASEIEQALHYLLNRNTMKQQLVHQYNTTPKLLRKPEPTVTHNNLNGMFVEITGGLPTTYLVNFINKADNTVAYTTTIKNNCWARATAEYYVDWKIEVKDLNSSFEYEYNLDLTNQYVLISMESKSLGDTLAWMPYVEEFRKKHNCHVVCSTFLNQLFVNQYPEISFVDPGTTVYNLAAWYKLGLFYKDNAINYNMHPSFPLPKPMQQWASDILGLPYTEIRPNINAPTVDVDDKLITIAIHSTAQAKYWNNPTGWQEIIDYLVSNGYTVKLLSTEGNGYMGNYEPTGIVKHPSGPLELVIEELKKSKLFIGISSGLSWLSWGLGVPTMVISGFSYPTAEPAECIRVSAPAGSCSGCFNRLRLDAGDWNWCPDHKNTPRQFECSKQITGEMVIKELQKVL